MQVPAIVALVISAAAVPAAASDDVARLLDGCAKLPAERDRAACFEAAARQIAGASQAPAAASRYAPVWTAFEAVGSQFSVGMTYVRFDELINAAAVASGQARGASKTKPEQEADDLIMRALDALADARNLWRAEVRFYSREGNRMAFAGGLPIKQAGVEEIVQRWDLPTTKADLWGLHRGVQLKPSVERLIQEADSLTAQARGFIAAPADSAK